MIRYCNFLFILVLILPAIGCSPSYEEKRNIAKEACAEIMATRGFESARRIKVLNEARKKTGLEPWPLNSEALDTSLKWTGKQWCEDQIAPPNQEELTRRKIAEDQRLERERLAKEQERLEKETAAREAKEALQNYTAAIEDYLKDFTFVLNDLSWAEENYALWDSLFANVSFPDHLIGDMTLELKDNLGRFEGNTSQTTNGKPESRLDELKVKYYDADGEYDPAPEHLMGRDIVPLIKSASILIWGATSDAPKEINRENFPGVGYQRVNLTKSINMEPALRASNLAKQKYDQALASWDRAVREELSNYEFYRQNPDGRGGCGDVSYSPRRNGLWLFVDRRVDSGDFGRLSFNVSVNENALIKQYDFSISLSGDFIIEFKDKSIPSIKRQLSPRDWELGGYNWKDCMFSFPRDNFSPEVQKYIKQKFGAEKQYESSKRAQLSPIPKSEYTAKLLIKAIELGGYSQTPFEIECDFYPELKERCKTDQFSTIPPTLPKPIEIAFK